MTDHRMNPGLITDVLAVLDRHGYARGDDEHAGRAVLLLHDLTRVYEGTQDHALGPAVNPAPVPQMAPEPPGPDSRSAVIVPASELTTVLAALDIAADYKRDRAEMCAECPDQSCPACQSRLHDAQAYDQMADRMLQATEAALAGHHGQGEPARPPRPSRLAADKEAGQWPSTAGHRTNPEPAANPTVPVPPPSGRETRTWARCRTPMTFRSPTPPAAGHQTVPST
jgi:hypothetical protein